MKTRGKAKQETRLKLLAAAKDELIKNGLLSISTVDVAKRAGVAHGTVFFHFQNKENLLVEVLDRELLEITSELYALLQASHDFESLLNTYLDFLEREETFFAILARETPLYAPELRRTILGREAAIRHYFYQALEKAIAQGQCKPVYITTTLNFLFGTLNYYLCLREAFAPQGSVIAAKRQTLLKTFMQYLSK
jgi:AcrR family transcriptional regulator